MTRFALIALFAFAVAGSASAQTPADTTAMPADSVAADSLTIELDPERARSLYDEGVTLLRERDYASALPLFDEALVYNPEYPAAALGRAQALAAQRQLAEAQEAYELAIALADASDASNAGSIKSAAERQLSQVSAALESAAAARAQAEAQAAAGEATQKVNQAAEILTGLNLTDEDADNFTPAADAYALLEQARMAGYDPDLAAAYYAKALVAMERGSEAVPYAETALAQSEGQADRSGMFILLAQAHIAAGNAAEARTALESIGDGESWSGWVPFYMGQVETLEAEG